MSCVELPAEFSEVSRLTQKRAAHRADMQAIVDALCKAEYLGSQYSRDVRQASGNQIRGLLMEYGVIIPKGISYIRKQIPLVLDAENGLTVLFRELLNGGNRG